MASSRRKPRCVVIAGPNGAGKTTFAKEYLPRVAKAIHFVNADLIAGGLSPLKPELAAIAAARLLLREINRLASDRANFAFENYAQWPYVPSAGWSLGSRWVIGLKSSIFDWTWLIWLCDALRPVCFRASRDAAPDPDLDFPETAEEMRDSNMKNYGWQSHKKKV